MQEETIPILVVASSPELGAQVNGMLRDRGVKCQVDWARNATDAGEQIDRKPYDIIFGLLPEIQPEALAALGNHDAVPVPVIGLASELDDDLIDTAFDAGLQDLILIGRTIHLAAATKRELAALQVRRTVQTSHAMAEAAAQDRDNLFATTGDALAQVDDGIVVKANAAWRELFGEAAAAAGTPVMDLFDPAKRDDVKKALRTTESVSIEIGAKKPSGQLTAVNAVVRKLPKGLHEVAIRSGHQDQSALVDELQRAQREDTETSLLNRNAFIDLVQKHTDHTLVLVRIDHFARVIEQMGVIGSNTVAVQLAKRLKERLPNGAEGGRLEGSLFGILIKETEKDAVREWADNWREDVGKATFDHAGRSMPITVSVGARLPDSGAPEAALDDALSALRTAHKEGGNRTEFFAPHVTVAPAANTKADDAEWASRIKQALVKGHFRLAFQAVASLRGNAAETNDLLLRLFDPVHGEVLPGEFLPAAERIGLMPAIDRWVIAEALKVLKTPASRERGTTLCVRLSDASVTNDTTLKWLTAQLQGIPAGKLVIELSERQSETWLKETKEIAVGAKGLGCAVMLSRFGVAKDPLVILKHLPLEYVKLDVSLLADINKDDAKQKLLRSMVEELKAANIASIGPQVEDANTMALLWQVGVDFVQGNYLQEAEVVIAEAS